MFTRVLLNLIAQSITQPRKLTNVWGQILLPEGKKQKAVAEAVAGDIVAIAKLKETETGDTLCDAGKPIVYESPVCMKPVISFALEPKTKGDEEKIFTGLLKLSEEDPALQLQRDVET